MLKPYSVKLSYCSDMRTLLFHLALLAIVVYPLMAQNSGTPGSYERLGFGARGIGMGNAMSSVSQGAAQTYYNPALGAFSDQRTASLTSSFLSFDRSLNFLSYTQAVKPTGGISLGIINSGVKNIDGRDGDGFHTEDYSTVEDEFYLAFSNRMTEEFSLGVTVKMYYAKLFQDITNTTVGFDAGALYKVTPELSIGGVIQDVSTKYKWDTKAIYDQNGRNTTDKFPQLRRIGVSYAPESKMGIIAVDFENSSEGTNMLKAGVEYNIMMDFFTIRGGVDRVVFDDKSPGAKPTFGFSANDTFGGWSPSITYAYVIEPFSPQGMHFVSLSVIF